MLRRCFLLVLSLCGGVVFLSPWIAGGITIRSLHSPWIVGGLTIRLDQGARTTPSRLPSELPKPNIGKAFKFNRPQVQDCNEKHPADLYKPIRQVLAEHPGIDGNCWFHFYADYLGQPASHALLFKQTIAAYSKNAGKGKEVTLHLTNGENVVTHLDGNWGVYPYDDAMCYMMGWLKGQRLDEHVMDLLDDAKWREVSAAECARLPEMVEGGLDENSREMTIGFMQDDNDRICQASNCLMAPPGAPCAKATLKDYVYHLYPKCLLEEHLTGASGQVAWCYARACITEGNVIRHGIECWPNGLPF